MNDELTLYWSVGRIMFEGQWVSNHMTEEIRLFECQGIMCIKNKHSGYIDPEADFSANIIRHFNLLASIHARRTYGAMNCILLLL